ncbi:MAG: response regulator [Spirochaetes bacterium]|nr:response regulator [Spirochaetota bacterium]
MPAIEHPVLVPIILLSLCTGILAIGTLLYLYIYYYSKKKLHLSVVIIGIISTMTTGNEIAVIVFGLIGMSELGMQFHRLQALSITLYLFALPFILHQVLELNRRLKRVNRVVYITGAVLACILIAIAYGAPDIFLSFTVRAGTVMTPWNIGRASPGPVYRIRDMMIFALGIYSIALIIVDLRMTGRYRYINFILAGMTVGILSGLTDMILAFRESETGLYSIRVFSVFNLGMTIFTILSMISIMKIFIDHENTAKSSMKNEYLELLAGGIAHDFNNILTGILGNATLALESYQRDDQTREMLTGIEKAAIRARDLTQQLLSFSRGGILFRDIVSLPSMIRETVDFILSGSDIKAHYRFSRDLWNVDVDVNQIGQVIQNLVINAKEAMPHKGELAISMENYVITNDSPALAAGNYLKICFRDSGTGIPEEHLRRIFEPYFSTKEKGNGLGLAISMSIVKKHGGYIEATSREGDGACITVYLPATLKSVRDKRKASTSPYRFHGRVLLMDDEEMVLEIAAKMLKQLGFAVVCVARGEDAVEHYRQSITSGEPFDLVITDLTIKGGMGGRETVEIIKTINPSATVVVTTGYSQDLIVTDYEKFGFDGAIIKPFTVEDVSREIERVLNAPR